MFNALTRNVGDGWVASPSVSGESPFSITAPQAGHVRDGFTPTRAGDLLQTRK